MRPVSLTVLVILLISFTVVGHADEVTVDQNNDKFDKAQLVVKVSDTIKFTNSDSVKHNLTVLTPDEESKNLGTANPGEVVKYSPLKPGIYDVRCSIHPRMKMKLKVQ